MVENCLLSKMKVSKTGRSEVSHTAVRYSGTNSENNTFSDVAVDMWPSGQWPPKQDLAPNFAYALHTHRNWQTERKHKNVKL
jgi:hypothetical protein